VESPSNLEHWEADWRSFSPLKPASHGRLAVSRPRDGAQAATSAGRTDPRQTETGLFQQRLGISGHALAGTRLLRLPSVVRLDSQSCGLETLLTRLSLSPLSLCPTKSLSVLRCSCNVLNHHSFLRRALFWLVPRAPCTHPLRFLVQVMTLLMLAVTFMSTFMFLYYPNDVLKMTARQSCLVLPDGTIKTANYARAALGSADGGVVCSLMKHSAQAALGARQTVEQVLGGERDTSDAAGPYPGEGEFGRSTTNEDLPPLITTPPPAKELRRDAMNVCILSMDTYGVKGMVGSWLKVVKRRLLVTDPCLSLFRAARQRHTGY